MARFLDLYPIYNYKRNQFDVLEIWFSYFWKLALIPNVLLQMDGDGFDPTTPHNFLKGGGGTIGNAFVERPYFLML